MHQNENWRKVLKIFIMSFLCSELQSNLIIPTGKITPIGYAYAAELNTNATYATAEDSRHHVSIRLAALDRNFGDGHICSGALIAPSAVVTAAQCVYNYVKNFRRHPSELRVVMGTQHRYLRTTHTLVYSVTHLYTPSTFDSNTLRDNIAVLMLERDVFEHSHIKPIPIRSDHSDVISRSSIATVTSWSSNEKGEPVAPLILLNTTLSHDIACHLSYGKIYNKNKVCVNFMDIHQSLCPYDAGAPLHLNGELVGLSSIGNDCSLRDLPAIYIDIKYHYKWIQEIIGDGTNQNSSIWGTIAFLLLTAFTLQTVNFKKLRTIGGFGET